LGEKELGESFQAPKYEVLNAATEVEYAKLVEALLNYLLQRE